MYKRYKKKISSESGQAFVQFLLVMPILIVVLSMLVDLWRIVDAKMLIQSAASESAMYLVEKSDKPSEIKGYIDNIIYNEYKGRLDPSKVKLSIRQVGPDVRKPYIFHSDYYDKGRKAYYEYYDQKIEIEYDVKLIMPLTKIVFGNKDSVKVKTEFITRVGKL